MKEDSPLQYERYTDLAQKDVERYNQEQNEQRKMTEDIEKQMKPVQEESDLLNR